LKALEFGGWRSREILAARTTAETSIVKLLKDIVIGQSVKFQDFDV
jgi:hypothetical protein